MGFALTLLLDVVLVLVFAVTGRASHHLDPAGFLLTGWPFLVALLIGHLIVLLLRSTGLRVWGLGGGVVIWIVTVAGGMLLRVATGDTAALAFVLVGTGMLGALLLGWRLIALIVRRVRRPRAA